MSPGYLPTGDASKESKKKKGQARRLPGPALRCLVLYVCLGALPLALLEYIAPQHPPPVRCIA